MVKNNYNEFSFCSTSSSSSSVKVNSLDSRAGGQKVWQVGGCLLIALHGPSLLWIARKAKLASRAAGQPM